MNQSLGLETKRLEWNESFRGSTCWSACGDKWFRGRCSSRAKKEGELKIKFIFDWFAFLVTFFLYLSRNKLINSIKNWNPWANRKRKKLKPSTIETFSSSFTKAWCHLWACSTSERWLLTLWNPWGSRVQSFTQNAQSSGTLSSTFPQDCST